MFLLRGTLIRWVIICPVIDFHFDNQVGVDVFQAPKIYPVLVWIRAPFVVCVDAAYRAEIVLRLFGVELIKTQLVLSFNNCKIR